MSPQADARRGLARALAGMRAGQRLTPCQIHPADWWHGNDGERATAVAFCASCPIQRLCARAGTYERYGVWGGVDREAEPLTGGSEEAA